MSEGHFSQLPDSEVLMRQDAPAWAEHLATVTAIYLECRSALAGEGVTLFPQQVLEMVKMVLDERQRAKHWDEERRRREWDQGAP